MAAHKIVVMICDQCQAFFETTEKSVSDARIQVVNVYGWKHKKGKDICSECQEEKEVVTSNYAATIFEIESLK